MGWCARRRRLQIPDASTRIRRGRRWQQGSTSTWLNFLAGERGLALLDISSMFWFASDGCIGGTSSDDCRIAVTIADYTPMQETLRGPRRTVRQFVLDGKYDLDVLL